MLVFGVDQRQIKKLEAALGDAANKLPREIKTAINATARKTKTAMSREVRKELAAPAKAVNKTLRIKSKATATDLSSTVEMKRTDRLSLKEFKAKQTGSGVSFRISKSSGRQSVPGAFQGPTPGRMSIKLRGHVFKRVGANRLPITKLFGPSPWGVFVARRLRKPVKTNAGKELAKQIDRRIRFNILKRSGAI